MTQPLLLWQHLGTVLQCCGAHEWCVLLLDYDGTLAPLVADPVTACPSPAMRQVLTLLMQHPHFRVAIMSGRTLADLQSHIDGQVPCTPGSRDTTVGAPQGNGGGGSPTTRMVGQRGGRALAGGVHARRAASDVPAGHLYW
jgi:Trehalose-phosphatase